MITIETQDYLTVKEIASKLGITEKTVRDWINEGELRATKIGTWRISPEDLQDFLIRRTRN